MTFYHFLNFKFITQAKDFCVFFDVSDKFINLGKSNHKCHMIDSDIWGSKSNIDESNICIGSLQREINIDNK